MPNVKWVLFFILMMLPANLKAEFHHFFRESRAREIRGYREWAEHECVIPEGAFEGETWRADTQPWAAMLLDLYDYGLREKVWNRFVIVGPVQSGKSLHGYVIPIVHSLFERRESTVCGIPTMDVSKDKWREEILPVIMKSPRYRKMIPRHGPGSRSGVGNLESVKFRNGKTLKFMSAGGRDSKRSSFTARIIACTEVDKMDTAGEASREADPITQIENRASSRDVMDRITWLECTVSIKSGRIWREYSNGTMSRIACRCPHCGEYVTPEKEHLRGWQDAETAAAAYRNAYFVCPACGEKIDDEQRREMNLHGVVIHKGQTVDRDGVIHGPLPDTRTLAFRWTAFNNMFWRIGTIAEKAWGIQEAEANNEDAESLKKEYMQFYWAEPYEPPILDDEPIKPKYVAERKGELQHLEIPTDTRYVTVGIDVHKRWLYYLVLALRGNGRIFVPDYGRVSVPSDIMTEQKAVKESLRDLEEQLGGGFGIPGQARRRLPDAAGADTGWLPDEMYDFIRGGKRKFEFYGTLGRGQSMRQKSHYRDPERLTQTVRAIGENYFVERVPKYRSWRVVMNVDYWKLRLQNCLRIEQGQPGAIEIFNSLEKNRHGRLGEHLTSEQFIRRVKPGGKVEEKWEVHGENHWLDCAVIALVLGRKLGFKFAPLLAVNSSAPPAASNWFEKQRGKE